MIWLLVLVAFLVVIAAFAHVSPFATGAMPAICTFRVDNSTKNSTMKRRNPLRVQTSTVKKSVATISSQCRLRNSLHVVFLLRSGAGSIP
jgi:hypothetical protein